MLPSLLRRAAEDQPGGQDGGPQPEHAVGEGRAADARPAAQSAVEAGPEGDVEPGARVGRPPAAQPHLALALALAAVQRELLRGRGSFHQRSTSPYSRASSAESSRPVRMSAAIRST